MVASIVSAIIAILVPALVKLVPMWIDGWVTDSAQKKKLQDAFDSFVSEYNKTKLESVSGKATYDAELGKLDAEAKNESNPNPPGKTS